VTSVDALPPAGVASVSGICLWLLPGDNAGNDRSDVASVPGGGRKLSIANWPMEMGRESLSKDRINAIKEPVVMNQRIERTS
jgi:hypothetical protein